MLAAFATRLPVELMIRLKEYSKKTDMPMTHIIAEAITEWLDKQETGE